MTKKTKLDLIKRFEMQLLALDRMINDNTKDESHTASLLIEYRKLTNLLSQIRDATTVD